jgi:hypothetical protein
MDYPQVDATVLKLFTGTHPKAGSELAAKGGRNFPSRPEPQAFVTQKNTVG